MSMSKVFLLIDDDADDRDLFKEALSVVAPRIICHYAGDGEEAFEKLNNNEYDDPSLIFLDINLPGMSGWDTLTKIKRSEGLKHIPVVMYSTSSHRRENEIAIDLGAICLITKPNDFKRLKEILALIAGHLDNNNSLDLLRDQVSPFFD